MAFIESITVGKDSFCSTVQVGKDHYAQDGKLLAVAAVEAKGELIIGVFMYNSFSVFTMNDS